MKSCIAMIDLGLELKSDLRVRVSIRLFAMP